MKPMQGKSLFSVWTEKYGIDIANVKLADWKLKCSLSNRKIDPSIFTTVKSGELNPMYGKKVIDCWIDKYGEDEANCMENSRRSKISKRTSGNLNPMFGKSQPQGSGNGWTGWYKGMIFYSLLELSFMLEMERNSVTYFRGENLKYRIKYIDKSGTERNYFPDFFIEDQKKLVECKPKHLMDSADVILKKKAAEDFCEINGMEYLLTSPDKLEFDSISRIRDSGDLIFIDRYEEKFKKIIENGNKKI
jgi:hypothetical protein